MKRYNWGNGYDRVGSEIKIKNWILKVTWTVQKEKDMIRNLAFQFKAQVENQKNSMVNKNCVICMTPG